MTFGRSVRLIRTNEQFEAEYCDKVGHLLKSEPVNRGPAHAMKDDTTALTHELMHVTEHFAVDEHMSAWQETVKPNLPWAEDHFQERIGGEPLNPSPSEAWWPYARKGNEEHKVHDQKFSHTYPERFWPKLAGSDNPEPTPYWDGNQGIRFAYGDLNDLVDILVKNPRSRQAYLPIWFPEDLTAAREGKRVPCSMGYHIIQNGETGHFDCVYTMRSCDVVRFYRDDIYMAGRLLQEVCKVLNIKGRDLYLPGNLIVHIDNLHCFPGDRPFLETYLPTAEPQLKDKRAHYNFGALG